jgi:uncharacterized protein YdhG (YjbR/CyaY superfamily)
MKNQIDDYILEFPEEIQTRLKQIRATVKAAAPEAEETIKYAMPTFVFHGNLVHFAAFQNHIGLYPTPSGIVAFKEDLSVYKGAKGSIQFPHNKPLPLELIGKIVAFRVKENNAKALIKKPRKS